MQSEFCEEWAELQPKTRIEHIPFRLLVTRLLLIAPTSSTFTRYRGMGLKNSVESTTYDSILLPADLPYAAICTVEATDRGPVEGMLYVYRCSVKTPSFAEAVALKRRLVDSIKPLQIEEDEVREHGLAVNARQEGACAPTGECIEGDVYVSATKGFKFLQIEANPVLMRNALAQAQAMMHGRNAPVSDISEKEGSLSFEVYSVGPEHK